MNKGDQSLVSLPIKVKKKYSPKEKVTSFRNSIMFNSQALVFTQKLSRIQEMNVMNKTHEKKFTRLVSD